MEKTRIFWGRKIEERSVKVIERMAKKGYFVSQTITNRWGDENSPISSKVIIFKK